ncbi:pyruvate:ferredoxin (flavodoxin) oxidoreductase [Aliikangiella marina]|uniref:Pyruvate-flavodoxin oxidoreductase n=1 Tax=Aliikangiella marina TaxID=1712262 RepID=A0A545TJL1_9GAMM|nr:pyruvate:ferredoxin (flavodoxin) oxidoreductase [Aliikangiella marina]TQV77351.1 pyruvate:ferredoxin (flavodoxin) oxidoreductase [Aliikangiella marina]
MNNSKSVLVDGNEAAASMAYAVNEVIAIYPITPASPMGELSDSWSAQGKSNLFGTVPTVIEMQSEAGAAGAVHGALQTGSFTTTFTASQGLLLMLPNMFKIAGELTPTVFHIAARSVATHALSIFCDHSDVMAARTTGFAMISANSVQEVQDLALISQVASLRSRIPILHFFDGFRTSHEISKIEAIPDSVIHQLLPENLLDDFRKRALNPNTPVIRGTSQNPDVFFQARETVNRYYQQFPTITQTVMNEFAKLTGRQYKLFEYYGDEQAERIVIAMGSACETLQETVDDLTAKGEKVAVIKVRVFRPFSAEALIKLIPDSIQAIAVLDRTKEPGGDGEPLYKDVVTTIAQALASSDESNQPQFNTMPKIIGGRYGLSSKEFTPAMVKSLFDELNQKQPKQEFTIGIHDDVSHLSLDWDEAYRTEQSKQNYQAIFYGLGSDGTVSANKNSIKIIGELSDNYVQGYFVYDSKKSGAVTVSHLRFGPQPIRSAYLIEDGQADFIACHQSTFLSKFPMLDKVKPGATFLINSDMASDKVWDTLPSETQEVILEKSIQLYVIDAYKIAKRAGLNKRINTIMQVCFFAISNVMERSVALQAIKDAVAKTYGRKSKMILKANLTAIDNALENLVKVEVNSSTKCTKQQAHSPDSKTASNFVEKVTKEIIAGRGDRIPVSLLPDDGSFPLGTAAYEKRDIALEMPVWETDLCTHCGKCVFVCPHSVIRSKAVDKKYLTRAPESFKHIQIKGKDYPDNIHISYQVSPLDCTGCGLCVEICPIRDKKQANRKALNMQDKKLTVKQEAINWSYFIGLPEYDRTQIKPTTMKGAMLMEPLFEFSGACVGCGETSYLRLASQLFGDRMLVANATGCSSIYGGNLPTTPWAKNVEGRGPAWNNSLFEDNAEFGLGMRIAIDSQQQFAKELLFKLRKDLDENLVDTINNATQTTEAEIFEQRERIAILQAALEKLDSKAARHLASIADNLVHKSVWIVGGDGWAYDIGYGGLDHVLASGRNVNILVLDTEVYSNTGGQTSKATPKGAVAKFSAAGKPARKKDLAKLAMSYENVYVAQVAYGAKDMQTLRAFIEAESYPGTSIIIAYSPCIAHGVDLSNNHLQQQKAVNSGHWSLLRYDPRKIENLENPLHLDSKAPSIPFKAFAQGETRFSMLWHSEPERAKQLLNEAEADALLKYEHYHQLANIPWTEHKENVSSQKSESGDKNDQ